MDLKIAQWCQENALANPWLASLARTLTGYGSLATIVAVTAVGAFLLSSAGKKNTALFWVLVVVSMVLVQYALKQAIHRARPPVELRDASVVEDGYSFPSGHTMAITVTCLALGSTLTTFYCGRAKKLLICLLLLFIVVGVGWSRFYLRAHWFSDVVGGWLIGAAWYAACSQFQEVVETPT